MFTFEEIAQIVGGTLLQGRGGRPAGIAHDSRCVKRGDLFVALAGDRVDGHAYLGEAFSRGAYGALVADRERAPAEAENLVVVDNVLSALQTLARAWRERVSVPMVAITGTNGKTTTKSLLAHILSGDREAFTTPANYNTEIGVPLAMLAMPESADVGVFEFGTEAPGEIRDLARLFRPDAAVLTSIGPGHLASFGSIEAIAQEKWSLIEALHPGAWGVINADVPELRLRAGGSGFEGTTAGFHHGSIRGRLIRAVPRVRIAVDALSLHAETSLLGEHNASNLLLACACAHRLGVASQIIERQTASYTGVEHRLQLCSAAFGGVLDDTYNANPASTRAALRVLAELGGKDTTRIFVFGTMFDLGERSFEDHVAIVETARALGIDRVIPVGPEATAACTAAGGAECVYVNEDRIGHWLRTALDGTDNLVLIKGSRALHLDRLAETVVEP